MNFTRSANAPTISAGVMQAKVIWKITKTYSGRYTPFEKVAAKVPGLTPARKALSSPPNRLGNGVPVEVKAIE